ncbi:MAG: hypothetical protein A2293_12690 [Elusimicrobia bacterium RIFOXYB2_FULL_49_7]|nr:MAG: hypothetical protein A2293_12690 [Elusimicrobia bacterium RIFOXYB2_FULL_49_7]
MIAKADMMTLFILSVISFFSVGSLAVIVIKLKAFRQTAAHNARFLSTFNQASDFATVTVSPMPEKCGTLENVCRAGLSEFNRVLKSLMHQSQDKISSFFIESQFSIVKDQLEKTVSEEVQKTDRYLVFLAITGSTCPLLGLLGTVWGITHAFTDIGKMGSASLNIVAPGIAEALITTIWGIAVALPAVISYNYFTNRARQFEDEGYNFSSHLLNLVKINLFSLLYKNREEASS